MNFKNHQLRQSEIGIARRLINNSAFSAPLRFKNKG